MLNTSLRHGARFLASSVELGSVMASNPLYDRVRPDGGPVSTRRIPSRMPHHLNVWNSRDPCAQVKIAPWAGADCRACW